MFKSLKRRLARPRVKDHVLETRLYHRRARLAAALVAAAMLGLFGRVAYLQTTAHHQLTTLADSNRMRLQPLPPTRGLIYDRNGVRLAENRPTYRLEVVPELTSELGLQTTLAELGKRVSIGDDELEEFRKRRRLLPPYASVPLKPRLSLAEVNRLAVDLHAFPGVDIGAGLSRYYPLSSLTAHVVGYVGRIDEKELTRIDPGDYRGSTHIGKTGVERSYETRLHGKAGLQHVETNAQGRVIRVLDRQPPVAGENLVLSIDIRLQRAARLALGDYTGAVVALDPANGEVLALVSQPGYDTNLFVHGIDVASYRALNTSEERPLYNRAVLGAYPPGSTIKPLLTLAGLETGAIDGRKHVFCRGSYRLPGRSRRFRDWKRGGHGRTDGAKAIVQSCDVYFYDLALTLGIDRMHDYLTQFGLGRRTGIDLLGEKSALLPSQQWKRRRHDEAWYAGDTIVAGIGQGFMLTTPLQLAHVTAAVASDGRRWRPRLLRAARAAGDAGATLTIEPAQPLAPVPVVDLQHWRYVQTAMAQVVQGGRGTAKRIRSDRYTIAGKTGTAQVFGLADDEEYDATKLRRKLHDHALFIAYAPVEEPQIALAVIVEHGGGGSRTAAPVARQVLDAFMLDRAPAGPRVTAAPRYDDGPRRR